MQEFNTIENMAIYSHAVNLLGFNPNRTENGTEIAHAKAAEIREKLTKGELIMQKTSDEKGYTDIEIVPAQNETEESELAQITHARDELILKSREMEFSEQAERASILEIVGMLKAHKISEQFNKTLRTIKLREIKDSKLYKGLTLINRDGEPVTIKSWAEFCKSLGTSEDQVDRDIKNLNTFGREFMELSESIGLSYRELQRMRANMQNPTLTEEEKQAIENAKEKDPNELLLILQDLQDKQASFEEQMKSLQEDKEAKNELLAKKSKEIDSLTIKLEKMSSGKADGKLEEKKRLLTGTEQKFSAALNVLQEVKYHLAVLTEEYGLDDEEKERLANGTLSFFQSCLVLLQAMPCETADFVQVVADMGFALGTESEKNNAE